MTYRGQNLLDMLRFLWWARQDRFLDDAVIGDPSDFEGYDDYCGADYSVPWVDEAEKFRPTGCSICDDTRYHLHSYCRENGNVVPVNYMGSGELSTS